MRTLSTLLALALLSGGAATAADRPERDRLAEALEGRTAGKPQECINTRIVQGSQTISDRTILFGRGGTIYRNDPPGGCPGLNSFRTIVTRTPSTQLCRGDIARIVDLPAGGEFGSCTLGPFVPYTRKR